MTRAAMVRSVQQRLGAFALIGALGSASSAAALAASQYSVIWQFHGNGEGSNPISRLTLDGAGGLFGTTANGGDNYQGAVFHLTPGEAGAPWRFASVHSFNGGDGAEPLGELYRARLSGALYGTTYNGGAGGAGTVFRLDPPTTGAGPWRITTLHDFTNGADGGNPRAGLALCGPYLCGTASGGGNGGLGVAYQVAPQARPGKPATFNVIFAFAGDLGGSAPYATLVPDGAGGLIGTDSGYAAGYGGVFRLQPTPGQPFPAPWTQTVLHNFFFDGVDGYEPLSPVRRAADGALYGVTYAGGKAGGGAIYRITPPGDPAGSWTETVLASFPAGCTPQSNLVADGRGGLLGTTIGCGKFGLGTVFRAAPRAVGGDWKITVLHDFAGGPDGEAPQSGLVRAEDGTFYGVTSGGNNSAGTVFAITP